MVALSFVCFCPRGPFTYNCLYEILYVGTIALINVGGIKLFKLLLSVHEPRWEILLKTWRVVNDGVMTPLVPIPKYIYTSQSASRKHLDVELNQFTRSPWADYNHA